jgi:hypothetical protein
LGAGSVSPKYQPSINKTTVTFVPNKIDMNKTDPKQDITKKYSYDKIKSVNQVTTTITNTIDPMKNFEKPTMKYPFSTTQTIKS